MLILLENKIPYVKSHGSLFSFYDEGKVSHDLLHTVIKKLEKFNRGCVVK